VIAAITLDKVLVNFERGTDSLGFWGFLKERSFFELFYVFGLGKLAIRTYS